MTQAPVDPFSRKSESAGRLFDFTVGDAWLDNHFLSNLLSVFRVLKWGLGLQGCFYQPPQKLQLVDMYIVLPCYYCLIICNAIARLFYRKISCLRWLCQVAGTLYFNYTTRILIFFKEVTKISTEPFRYHSIDLLIAIDQLSPALNWNDIRKGGDCRRRFGKFYLWKRRHLLRFLHKQNWSFATFNRNMC